MAKSDYEKMLKRIEKNLIKHSKVTDDRFELPPVDVMWEGQKTYLRNFVEYPKIMRRDPAKLLQYLSKEFAVPAERVGDSAMFTGKRDPDDFTRLLFLVLAFLLVPLLSVGMVMMYEMSMDSQLLDLELEDEFLVLTIGFMLGFLASRAISYLKPYLNPKA